MKRSNPNRRPYPLLCAAGASLVFAPHTSGQGGSVVQRVEMTTLASHPSSQLPGSPGLRFTQILDVSVSPGGHHVGVMAEVGSPSSVNGVTLLDGQVLAREGVTPLPWDPSRTWPHANIAVNDAGTLITTAHRIGTEAWVARSMHLGQGPWSVLESHQSPLSPWPGLTLDSVHEPFVDREGGGYFVAELRDGLGQLTRAIYRTDVDLRVAELGWSSIAGPSGSSTLTSMPYGWNFANPRVRGNGRDVTYLGGAPGAMIIQNNTAVVASGAPLAGGQNVHQLLGFDLSAGGRLLTWGTFTFGAEDFVALDGALIAEAGGAIPGSSDTWYLGSPSIRTFTDAAINDYGDVAIAGRAGFFNNIGDHVLVANGRVIARQGDPVDLDGNLLFDDDAIIRAIVEVHAYDDNGRVHFTASVQRNNPFEVGVALISEFASYNPAIALCEGEPNSTLDPATLELIGSNLLVDDDLRLRVESLPVGALGYLLVSKEDGPSVQPPGSQGSICISGPIGRYNNSIIQSNSSGTAFFTPSLGQIPTPTGLVPGLIGDDLKFQCWYRDANPAPTSNFSGALEVRIR